MAFNTDKNSILFQRYKAWAAAAQNLREEGQRLRDIIALEASPSGVDDAAFVDVAAVATKAALKNLNGVLGEHEAFYTGGAVSQFNRKDYLTPFIDTTPA